ncbi:MAG: hypothetical protein JOZ42_01190 [Acetobacteraceae bacterium]|nr:hypothetical protein [Acetobacteraceae bacterium]
MPRTLTLAASLALATALGVAGATAQTATGTTSPSGQSAYPPTTGSNQGVDPPGSMPGPTAHSATPGSAQPDRVPTGNPSADTKATTVR